MLKHPHSWIFVAAFLLSMPSCSPKPNPWSTVVIPNAERSCLSYDNAELITLEIHQTKNGPQVYLNLLSLPIEHETVEVTYTIDGVKGTTQGTVLKGGQKVALPQESTDAIINALKEKKEVSIELSMYHLKVGG